MNFFEFADEHPVLIGIVVLFIVNGVVSGVVDIVRAFTGACS